MGLKQCRECEEWLDEENDFYIYNKKRGYRQSICKVCANERRMERYYAFREEELANAKRRMKQNNFAVAKKWRVVHRKQYNKYMRDYRKRKKLLD